MYKNVTSHYSDLYNIEFTEIIYICIHITANYIKVYSLFCKSILIFGILEIAIGNSI